MRRGWQAAFLILTCVGFAPEVRAGIRPSFLLVDCSWSATHVVVVSQGEKLDGNFQVVESWKGDLKKGSRLKIKELAAFAPKATRAIEARDKKRNPPPPTHVSGSRMILFLKKNVAPAKAREGEKAAGKEGEISWAPAGFFKDVRVSVAWVEHGETYGFVQIMNPGPSALISLESTEKQMRGHVLEICKTQEALGKASALPDPTRRAEALVPFVHSERFQVRHEAFNALGGCGEAALPSLRKMLQDPSLAGKHGAVVKALAQAGGERVGPELTKLVEVELAFWKKTAPGLQVGWWGGNNLTEAEQQHLQNRYGKVLEAIYALEKIRFSGCRNAVTAFRDYWRSLPQLEDRSGLNQMSEACDSLLHALPK
jgi:hypothetical protein